MAAPASPLPSNELVPDDFLSLADLRGRLTGEISTLSKEIEQISDFDLRYAEEDQARLKDMETSINQRKAVTALTEEEAQRLRMDESEYEYRKSRSQDPTKLMAKLEEKRRQLDQKQAYSNQIQAKILKMLSPEQEFKRTMSITFAALISIVIIGFFIIALRDEKIRQAIFSGETGIQFLTLFSIVIAIILFGITQILEGKELSALLGGLSGYILGRVTPKREA